MPYRVEGVGARQTKLVVHWSLLQSGVLGLGCSILVVGRVVHLGVAVVVAPDSADTSAVVADLDVVDEVVPLLHSDFG